MCSFLARWATTDYHFFPSAQYQHQQRLHYLQMFRISKDHTITTVAHSLSRMVLSYLSFDNENLSSHERVLSRTQLDNELRKQATRPYSHFFCITQTTNSSADLVTILYGSDHHVSCSFDVFTASKRQKVEHAKPSGMNDTEKYITRAIVYTDNASAQWSIIRTGYGDFPTPTSSLEQFIVDLQRELEAFSGRSVHHKTERGCY